MNALPASNDLPKRKRKPDTGLIRPYRPCPPDFLDIYAQMGWDGIDEHFRTNWRTIRRWIIETGPDRCRIARSRYLQAHGLRVHHRETPRRSDYVMGRRLIPARKFNWGRIPVGAQLNLQVDGMDVFTAPGATKREPPRVSAQARMKFLEEVKGVDMAALDAEILSPTMALADALGGAKVIMKSGHKAVVKDGVIVTIESKAKRRRTR